MQDICMQNLSKLKQKCTCEGLTDSIMHFSFNNLKKDIEKNPRSEPSSRSNSFRKKKNVQIDQMEQEVLRRHSMPQDSKTRMSASCNDLNQGPFRRVRSFKITSKGLLNKGDNFRRESNASVASSGSSKTDKVNAARQRLPSGNSDESYDIESCASSTLPGYYQVFVVGAPDVGKTSLIKQFMTSECIGIFDCDDENDLQTVSVHLDGEESTLEFVEIPNIENQLDTSICADAYLVVFAVSERSTFDAAVEHIRLIRDVIGSDRTVILVANKIDLARHRTVSSKEAKFIADQNNCKYAETSVTLNHQVDELLAGLLKQIHLKLEVTIMDTKKPGNQSLINGYKSLLYRIFRKSDNNENICDDLYKT